MRYDAAVAEGARVTEGVRIGGVIVYTVLVVTMTVYCMRCFMSRKSVAVVEVEVRDTGTQTVRDVDEIMDHTIDAIRGQLRMRGLRGTGSKEQLAVRLHEHLLHEARDDPRGALGRI